jgi:DNA-binding response OmpR family regulator
MGEEGRVLVVEDDQDIREMMAECLRDRCTVSVAEDGTQALQILTRQKFDAIVVDLELPRLSGSALLRQLLERGIRVPTVMVSGAPDAQRIALETHAAFISKPFDVERLVGKVDELLRDEHPTVAQSARRRTRQELRPSAHGRLRRQTDPIARARTRDARPGRRRPAL